MYKRQAPRFHLEFDNFVYNHPHHDILSVLLYGGIVALVLYLMLVGWALGILYKNRTELLSHICCAALAGFFAVALMEPLFSDVYKRQPDDSFGPETLENVSRFFDSCYDEVDLVTYPIRCV